MLRRMLRARQGAPGGTAAGDLERLIHSLQESLEARETVLSAMSEGVLLFDPAGSIVYANRRSTAILGRRFDKASEVAPDVLRDTILQARGVGAPGQPDQVTRQVETADAIIEVTVLPAVPPGTLVAILRDVTRARSTERLRRDFVANASHELKTPVASILALAGAARAAAASNSPDAVARFSARLEYEAERLAALVSDLLELSRLEGSVAKRAEVRLDRVVEAEVDRMRPRAEGAGLRLQLSKPEVLRVLGSEPDLAHLVHNILDNAVRYTPPGGVIEVSAGRTDKDAEISVSDSGVGIPPPDLDRIFERFYRVDTARSRETGGTGLGLSIVRNITEAHGGSVEVQSVLGEGSTFTVRLPLLE